MQLLIFPAKINSEHSRPTQTPCRYYRMLYLTKRDELILYLLIPIFVLMIAIASEYSGFDMWLESFYYDVKTHSWPYKSLFITSVVLHTWAKYFIVFLALINFLTIIATFFVKPVATYRKYLIYTFVAAVSGPLVVGWLKDITHIYIPWDLTLFGGDKPHIRLFDSITIGAPVGHGFPGGHSSGGFSYLSLYFCLLIIHRQYRYYVLAIPMILGIVFSIDQEMRGAHFISHDLVSFAICWSLSLSWFLVFFPGYFRKAIDDC